MLDHCMSSIRSYHPAQTVARIGDFSVFFGIRDNHLRSVYLGKLSFREKLRLPMFALIEVEKQPLAHINYVRNDSPGGRDSLELIVEGCLLYLILFLAIRQSKIGRLSRGDHREVAAGHT